MISVLVYRGGRFKGIDAAKLLSLLIGHWWQTILEVLQSQITVIFQYRKKEDPPPENKANWLTEWAPPEGPNNR